MTPRRATRAFSFCETAEVTGTKIARVPIGSIVTASESLGRLVQSRRAPLAHGVLLLQRRDRVQAFAQGADPFDAGRGGGKSGDACDAVLQRRAPNVGVVVERLAT